MEELSEQKWKEVIAGDGRVVLFLYTPLCGTCKVAEQMLVPLEKLFDKETFVKADANFIPGFMAREEVTSVPCLKVLEHGKAIKTIYAFQSVPSLVARLYPLFKE